MLTFTTPTGTVGPTDSIPVFVTLTLDPASVALRTDASANVTSGLALSDMPSDFNVLSSFLTIAFECSGTFTASCITGPPYQFDFNFILGQFNSLNILPGASQNFSFGIFTPTPSPAPAGTYVFFNAIFEIGLSGNSTDPNTGLSVDGFRFLPFADTCPSHDPACAFTRTVPGAAVPEPSTWLLLGSGLAGLAIWRRKRQG